LIEKGNARSQQNIIEYNKIKDADLLQITDQETPPPPVTFIDHEAINLLHVPGRIYHAGNCGCGRCT
jgi:hypothetical protein